MRIAIFTDSYKPQVNGVVSSIEMFTKELRSRGHDVHIFAPDAPGAKKEKNVHRIKSVEFMNYPEYRIGLPFRLLFKQDMNRFDVVHIESPFSVGVTGLGLSKFHGIPTVSTFHTMYPDYSHYLVRPAVLTKAKGFKEVFDMFSWKYMRWFFNKTKVVIAPSNETKKILEKRGIKHVVVIPTGITKRMEHRPKGVLRKKHKLGNEKIILHVGRITREKNMEFIINALEKLLNTGVKLIVTSDGPHREKLEKMVREKGLKKNVIFTGYLSESEINEYYSLADVFVMASRTETQGLVLLEAAKNNLPAVVLNAPVIADFVRENKTGIVTTKNRFAVDVKALLENDTTHNDIIKHCQAAAERYSMERCTDQLLRVYARAAKMKQKKLFSREMFSRRRK
jgi:1,2-diacylglycerol 3-alpha-glucosyltransferase